MPIKDLSETIRAPRLGKIHLGIKDPERGYPIKTDYFVFPKDHPDYEKIVKIYGEKPKELNIYIPFENEEDWSPQYYKAYNQTFGLVCKGDGVTATRMNDVETNTLPTKNTHSFTMQEIDCLGRECPEYQDKKCHEVMNLHFILPDVPGLGVWQIDTGSINSILNINSCARLIKRTFGKLTHIPLKLTLEPMQVKSPETGKKQTVYVLNLRTDVTMSQLASVAREKTKALMVGEKELETAAEAEVEQDIQDMWPEDKKPESKEVEVEPEPEPEPTPKPEKPVKPPRDALTIKTITQLMKACNEDFKMQPKDVLAELNVHSQSEITDLPSECYTRIASVR